MCHGSSDHTLLHLTKLIFRLPPPRRAAPPALSEIKAFAAQGWRVLCPSQLGYGDTDAPVDVAAYGFKSVAYDMNSLLDECGVPGKVVMVGHDW